jgi:serine/threonine protein kinase
MLKGLNYDRNIVQFYGACTRQGCQPLLITEYMEGGPACPCITVRQGKRDQRCTFVLGGVVDGFLTATLLTCVGGDLCSAIQADTSGDLLWYGLGHRIALDIARGLYFLHSHEVQRCAFCSACAARCLLLGAGGPACVLRHGVRHPGQTCCQLYHAQVVHADMKSKNVLLNGAMHAKISDVRSSPCITCQLLTRSCAGCPHCRLAPCRAACMG